MNLAGTLGIVAVGTLGYFAGRAGDFGPGVQKITGDIRTAIAPFLGVIGLPIVPCPTADELAVKLGVSVYHVRTAMARSGHDGCHLSLADLAGIPEVPNMVLVNGVPSYPNPQGAPATWSNPTGGSGTWGGLTDAQIQQSFLNANGGDPAKAAAAWAAQHAAEVAARGF